MLLRLRPGTRRGSLAGGRFGAQPLGFRHPDIRRHGFPCHRAAVLLRRGGWSGRFAGFTLDRNALVEQLCRRLRFLDTVLGLSQQLALALLLAPGFGRQFEIGARP